MKKALFLSIILCVLFFVKPNCTYSFPISDTGQTKCYNNTEEIDCPQPGEAFYGQDGTYLINPPSYTKLDASGNDLPDSAAAWVMVRDNVTGLIWEVKTDDGTIHDKDKEYNWQDAKDIFITAVNAEKLGDWSDWRMPTINELESIANLGRYNPAVNIDYFPNTLSSDFWSSTTYASSSSDYAWNVRFYLGNSYNRSKSYTRSVRAVRSGQSRSLDHLVINGDGTVTDTDMGLMWQQATEGPMTWESALSHCKNLTLDGFDDWRLPNRRELRSLVDYSRNNPAIYASYFPSTFSTFYWSSTTYASDSDSAWRVTFYYGGDSGGSKPDSYYVRAVRSGQSRILGHLFISAPVQGSAWETGNTLLIQWDTAGLGGNVAISLSRHGGKTGTFETLVASTENDGSYDWVVTGQISPNCALKIEPLSDPSKGTMQSLFTIASTTAPSATISGQPISPTNVNSATLTVGGEGVTHYRYSLDGGSYGSETAVTNAITLTGLSDASHTISAIGRDTAGNWQAEASATAVSWTVDTVAPTITGLTDDATPTQSKTWTWDANETATFRYNIDQNQVWTPSGNYSDVRTATKTGVNGTWYIHVQAKDVAGNESSVTTVSTVLANNSSTLYVSGNGECDNQTPCHESIQKAIDDATTGSTILVEKGTYAESLNVGGGKTLLIKGGYDSTYKQQTANTTFIEATGPTTIKASSGSLKFEMINVK